MPTVPAGGPPKVIVWAALADGGGALTWGRRCSCVAGLVGVDRAGAGGDVGDGRAATVQTDGRGEVKVTVRPAVVRRP